MWSTDCISVSYLTVQVSILLMYDIFSSQFNSMLFIGLSSIKMKMKNINTFFVINSGSFYLENKFSLL